MSEEDKLMPCAHCGGEAKVHEVKCTGYFSIECPTADCAFVSAYGKNKAVAAWNRRTPDPLARLAVAVAEKAGEAKAAQKAEISAILLSANAKNAEESEALWPAADEADRKFQSATAVMDKALSAYLAARSSPPAALREAELDRLAREVAEAGIFRGDASKRVRDLASATNVRDGTWDGANRDSAVAQSRYDAALAVYRAAKERTAAP